MNIPVYECPVDGCDWQLSQLDYERNRPPFRAKVTIDAGGAPRLYLNEVVEANAKHIEVLLRDHLETHDVFDWVRTVQRLTQDLAQPGGVREHAVGIRSADGRVDGFARLASDRYHEAACCWPADWCSCSKKS